MSTGPASTFATAARPGLSEDPQWYRTAVFYEVLLRAFTDSDGSGTGDLRGLIGRLDYLQWLGVDCLWLPPFYPSPLRDGGGECTPHVGAGVIGATRPCENFHKGKNLNVFRCSVKA